ncbi:mechanosensitive ion channel family protein [Thioclava sp. SK-1]|uniref:mechanosensitive ion channel family protein n=1 Tax=Thioclava sp. SK-1 TaxID=1889770 RepID=UPI000B22C8D6|nr:mechanosensitive ion channel domain-containing protein [Thioclava sp. SK-1]
MNLDELSQVSTWLTEDRITAAIAGALNVLMALAILIVALIVAGWARARINNLALRHAKLDATLFGFLGNLVKYLILAIGFIFILNRFGIQTTSLAALIGAAGLAIGLALQGTLSSLASGVMIIMFRPFRVGDYIDAGSQGGTVTEISLFYVNLKTYDGIHIVVPNSDIWSSAITNYSENPTRMMDLTVGIAYDADIKTARDILQRIANDDTRVLADPAPQVGVRELGDSSVNLMFRAWCNTSDYWSFRWEVFEMVKTEFDANGIGIPFPTRTLVLEGGKEVQETVKPRLS